MSCPLIFLTLTEIQIMSLNTETNKMKPIPSKVKGRTVTNLKTKRKSRTFASAMKGFVLDDRGCIAISALKPHPLNEKLYPMFKHSGQIELLGEQMLKEYEKFGIPNHTAIDICPETGTINSGHFRYYSALEHGWKYLRAQFGRPLDPSFEEFDEILFLRKFNVDGKRDEYDWETLVHNYNIQNAAFEKKYKRELNGREISQFALENRKDPKKFKKYVVLSNEHPNIYQLVLDGTYTIGKGWEKSKDPKSTEIVDPNRHTFYGDLIKYPSIEKHLIERSISVTRAHIAVGGNLMDDSVAGWESQFKTGIWSNALMSALTEAFNNTGDKELQCISAGAEGNKTYADVLFPYQTNLANKKLKGKGTYFDTQIEIKAAEWNKTAGKTKIYSGFGSANMAEQEFIIGIHCDNFSRFIIMMVTIGGEHWKRRANDAEISLSQIFKCEPTYLLGEMFKQKSLIQPQWGKVD